MALNYTQREQILGIFSPTYENSSIKSFAPFDTGMIRSIVIPDQAQAVYFLRGTPGGTMKNYSPGEAIPTTSMNDAIRRIEPKFRPYADGIHINASEMFGRRDPVSLDASDPALVKDILMLAASQLATRISNTAKLSMAAAFLPSVTIDGIGTTNDTGLVQQDWTTGTDNPYAGSWGTNTSDIYSQLIWKRDNYFGANLSVEGMTVMLPSKQRTNLQRNETIVNDKDLSVLNYPEVRQKLLIEKINLVDWDDVYYSDDLQGVEDIYSISKINRYLSENYIVTVPNYYFAQNNNGLDLTYQKIQPNSNSAPFIDFIRATPPDFADHARIFSSKGLSMPQKQYLIGNWDGAYIYLGEDLITPDKPAVYKALAVTSFANFVSPAVKINYIKVQ